MVMESNERNLFNFEVLWSFLYKLSTSDFNMKGAKSVFDVVRIRLFLLKKSSEVWYFHHT